MILKDFKGLLEVELNIFEDSLECHIAFSMGGDADALTVVEEGGDYCGITEEQKSAQICPQWSVNTGAESHVRFTSGLLLNMAGGSGP